MLFRTCQIRKRKNSVFSCISRILTSGLKKLCILNIHLSYIDNNFLLFCQMQTVLSVEIRICRLYPIQGVRPPPKWGCLGYETKLHQMESSRYLGRVEYSFMAITLRLTLTRSGNTG